MRFTLAAIPIASGMGPCLVQTTRQARLRSRLDFVDRLGPTRDWESLACGGGDQAFRARSKERFFD